MARWVMSVTILVRGGHAGLSGAPFSWPGGSTAAKAFIPFAAPLITKNPPRLVHPPP